MRASLHRHVRGASFGDELAASASAARGAATARLEEAVAAVQKLRAEVPWVGLHGAGPPSALGGHAAEEEEEEAAKSRRDPGLRPQSHSQSQSVARRPPPPPPPPLAASVERSKEADAVARRLDALDDGVRAEGEHALDQLVHGMLAMPCIRARLDQVYGRATQPELDVPPRAARRAPRPSTAPPLLQALGVLPGLSTVAPGGR